MNPGNFFLRIVLMFVIAGALTACQTSSESGTKMYHVGILAGLDVFDDVIDGFKNEMAVQGYIEGDNITYEIKRANGDQDVLQQMADEFVAERVDLIVTITNGAALAARRATANTDIPVVFTIVLAPVKTGVVDDLAKPGGSVTGVRNPLELFIGKRLEIIHNIFPDCSRVWAPYPAYVTEQVILPRAREDAGKLGMTLVETQVATPNDILTAIGNFSASPEIPFNAARIAKSVLAGEPPSETPIETADVSLVVNIKTTDSLGLELPSVLLHQADAFIR